MGTVWSSLTLSVLTFENARQDLRWSTDTVFLAFRAFPGMTFTRFRGMLGKAKAGEGYRQVFNMITLEHRLITEGHQNKRRDG